MSGDSELSAAQQMISSGCGAVLVSLSMTPLDVVKIRLQVQERQAQHSTKCFLYSNGLMDHLCPRLNGEPLNRSGPGSGLFHRIRFIFDSCRTLHTAQEICECKWYNRPKYFTGTWDALFKIGKTEGLSSLWSGLSPTLVLAIPTTVVYFTLYEQLKTKISLMHRNFKGLSPEAYSSPSSISLASGASARFVAVLLVSPLELIRTKMQSQKMPFSQVTRCLEDLVKTQGLRGLWRGCTATLLRDVPFSGLYWPLYENTKDRLRTSLLVSSPREEFLVSFASGALAGSVASTVTLPFDVIKTFRQIDIGEKEIMGVKKGEVPSNLNVARDLVAKQGPRALFVGLIPRLLKVAPACAIMISSYEYCKGLFKDYNIKDNT